MISTKQSTALCLIKRQFPNLSKESMTKSGSIHTRENLQTQRTDSTLHSSWLNCNKVIRTRIHWWLQETLVASRYQLSKFRRGITSRVICGHNLRGTSSINAIKHKAAMMWQSTSSQEKPLTTPKPSSTLNRKRNRSVSNPQLKTTHETGPLMRLGIMTTKDVTRTIGHKVLIYWQEQQPVLISTSS